MVGEYGICFTFLNDQHGIELVKAADEEGVIKF